MPEHTPLPWKVSEPDLSQIIGDDGAVVADVWAWTSFGMSEDAKEPQPQEGNARLIVRAVNSHDALLEALEKMHVCLNNRIIGTGADPSHDHEFWQECIQACELSAAAISNARKEG